MAVLVTPALLHGPNHLLGCHRPCARPVGLMAAKRCQREAAPGVVGNDVRVDVDIFHVDVPFVGGFVVDFQGGASRWAVPS